MQDPYRAKISAIGNSLGIIIPRPVLRGYDLERGDIVRFNVKHETEIRITKEPNL